MQTHYIESSTESDVDAVINELLAGASDAVLEEAGGVMEGSLLNTCYPPRSNC